MEVKIKGVVIKRDYIYLLVILILIAVFFINKGCERRETDKLINDIATYKTEASIYKTKHGLEVSTNKALMLQTQAQMKSFLASNDTIKEWINKFKEIKGGFVIKETTIIKEVAVPFDRNIPCDFKPFAANKITKDFMFYSTISNTGLTIDTLKIPNKATVVIGMRKDNFFSKAKMVVDVNNSNPYIQTSNISGFVYTPEKKWFEKTWVHILFGVAAGAAGTQAINNKLK